MLIAALGGLVAVLGALPELQLGIERGQLHLADGRLRGADFRNVGHLRDAGEEALRALEDVKLGLGLFHLGNERLAVPALLGLDLLQQPLADPRPDRLKASLDFLHALYLYALRALGALHALRLLLRLDAPGLPAASGLGH